MLRATTVCTFSTSHLPNVVRECCVLYILTLQCASRHNGVHFSTSPQLPKVVRECCVLYILTLQCASRHNGMRFLDISTSKSGPRPSEFLISKRASRYNGVQFFISHVARWLRTSCFSKPIFRPSGATNHWENIVLHDFSTFLRACIFFLLNLSLIFFLLFSALLFSDSFHLCFSSAHIVGSLTSKLPWHFF